MTWYPCSNCGYEGAGHSCCDCGWSKCECKCPVEKQRARKVEFLLRNITTKELKQEYKRRLIEEKEEKLRERKRKQEELKRKKIELEAVLKDIQKLENNLNE